MDTSVIAAIIAGLIALGALGFAFVVFGRLNNSEKLLQQERVKCGVAETELRIASGNSAEIKTQNLKLLEENSKLHRDAAAFIEREKALDEKLAEFEKFSAQVFEFARTKFESSNKSQLDVLLNPLKEDLKTFRKRIEDMNAEGELKRGSLEAQIKYLSEMNRNLSQEASNLASALKGGNKTAGNWGELVLERLLEGCGLREGHTFIREDSHSTDDRRLRPDVVIKLPEGRNFIVDSKVSLVHYERYMSSEDEGGSAAALKAFVDSVKTHIKGLSSKKYEAIEGLENPDFVMLFMPIEAAFSLLVWAEPSILDFAYSNKIVIASPSTLLASFKTVETVWRKDSQNKNTIKIAQAGGLLYDKVVVFMEKFQKLEKTITTLKTDYDEISTTVSGRGGLLVSAQKLEELGANAKKKLKAVSEEEEDGEEPR